MKKKIGVTQRVEVINRYDERRDCLDQNWIRLLDQLNFQGLPLPNVCERPAEYLDALSLSGIILSGGNNLTILGDTPGTAPERDSFERNVLDWAGSNELPVLGVCRGFQMMNCYLGGRLTPVEGHVAIRHTIIPTLNVQSILGKRGEVNSFHDYCIKSNDLGKGLEPLATATGDIIEAARHNSLPWIGIMWHPEREKPFNKIDLQLISETFIGDRN